jgi:hypothetical membrane protein
MKPIKSPIALAGVASVLCFIILYGLAVLSYPGYSPSTNYLSDLGIGPVSSQFFNLGIVVSGFFGLILASVLYKSSITISGKVGVVILAIGLVSYVLIAYFTESTPLYHAIFAGAFFFMSAISFVFLGLEFRQRSSLLGYFSFAMSLPIILFMIFGMMPILEHVAVAGILLWSAVVGWYFGRE